MTSRRVATQDVSMGTHWPAKPLLVVVTLVPLATFVVTYAISLSNGSMAYPYYFLSTSIEAKPAANIGTFGLCLSSAAIPLTAFIRHARVKFAAEGVVDVGMRKKARSLNTKALKIVVVAAISGVGVASFQSTVDA